MAADSPRRRTDIPTVVITGSSSPVGREIVAQLLTRDPKTFRVRLCTHGPIEELQPGVEAFPVDNEDVDSLVAAFTGATYAVFIPPLCPNMSLHTENMITAARDAGIKHIFKISWLSAADGGPSTPALWHDEANKLIRDCPIPHTILLHATLYQNLITQHGDPIRAESRITLPVSGTAQVASVDAADVALYLICLMEDAPTHSGVEYTLTGRQPYSNNERAEILSAVLGREVKFEQVTPDVAALALRTAGVPQWKIDALLSVCRQMDEGAMARVLGQEDYTSITRHFTKVFQDFADVNAEFFESADVEDVDLTKAPPVGEALAKAAMKGSLQKRGSKFPHPWQSRYCVVACGLMYYCKSDTADEPQGILLLKGCKVSRSPAHGATGLEVTIHKSLTLGTKTEFKQRTFYFKAPSVALAEEWVQKIKDNSVYVSAEFKAKPRLSEFDTVVQQFRTNLLLRDQKQGLKTYKNAFTGQEAVGAMVGKVRGCRDAAQAISFGQQMMEKGVFYHVAERERAFENTVELYQFNPYYIAEGVDSSMDEDEDAFDDLVDRFRKGVDVKNRSYRMKSYKDCFVGSEAVGWLRRNVPALPSADAAVALGQKMVRRGVFYHVVDRAKAFKNDNYFYIFNPLYTARRKESSTAGGRSLSMLSSSGAAAAAYAASEPRSLTMVGARRPPTSPAPDDRPRAAPAPPTPTSPPAMPPRDQSSAGLTRSTSAGSLPNANGAPPSPTTETPPKAARPGPAGGPAVPPRPLTTPTRPEKPAGPGTPPSPTVTVSAPESPRDLPRERPRVTRSGPPLIVVTGARGNAGGYIVRHLVEQLKEAKAAKKPAPFLIRAAVHDPTAAVFDPVVEVVPLENNDAKSVAAAFSGASYVVSSLAATPALSTQSLIMVRAAFDAGVEHIIKLSHMTTVHAGMSTLAQWHEESDQIIAAGGVPVTFVHAAPFFQNIIQFQDEAISTQNAFAYPMPKDVKYHAIDAYDVAAFVAAILKAPHSNIGWRDYVISSADNPSPAERANILSSVVGREIRYTELTVEQFQQALRTRGAMPWLVDLLSGVFAAFARGDAVGVYGVNDFNDLVGRDPRTFQDFVQANTSAFMPQEAMEADLSHLPPMSVVIGRAAFKGMLTKRGNNFPYSWRQRFCVVSGGKFYYTAQDNQDVAMGVLLLKGATIQRVPANGAFAFSVTTRQSFIVSKQVESTEHVYYFRASSRAEMESWERTLQESAAVGLKIGHLTSKKRMTRFDEQVEILRTHVSIKDRTYLFKPYKMCFVGAEAVAVMMAKIPETKTVEEAVALGQAMQEKGVLAHVVDAAKPFINAEFFYQFNPFYKPEELPSPDSDAAYLREEEEFERKVRRLRDVVDVRPRKFRLKEYPDCFVGSEAVQWMRSSFNDVETDEDAVALGQRMIQRGVFRHVVDRKKPFKNGPFFYMFNQFYKSGVEAAKLPSSAPRIQETPRPGPAPPSPAPPAQRPGDPAIVAQPAPVVQAEPEPVKPMPEPEPLEVLEGVAATLAGYLKIRRVTANDETVWDDRWVQVLRQEEEGFILCWWPTKAPSNLPYNALGKAFLEGDDCGVLPSQTSYFGVTSGTLIFNFKAGSKEEQLMWSRGLSRIMGQAESADLVATKDTGASASPVPGVAKAAPAAPAPAPAPAAAAKAPAPSPASAAKAAPPSPPPAAPAPAPAAPVSPIGASFPLPSTSEKTTVVLAGATPRLSKEALDSAPEPAPQASNASTPTTATGAPDEEDDRESAHANSAHGKKRKKKRKPNSAEIGGAGLSPGYVPKKSHAAVADDEALFAPEHSPPVEDTQRNVPVFKIVLLGDSGVGKTSLMKRFVTREFSGDFKSTVGADFLARTIRVGDHQLSLQIWDTAGQERFASVVSAYYRGADAVAIVFDVNRRDSFDKVTKWWENFLAVSKPVQPVLLGNKTDLNPASRSVLAAEARERARELFGNSGFEPMYFETSAQTGSGVDEAFQALGGVLDPTKRAVVESPTYAVRLATAADDDDGPGRPGEPAQRSGGGCPC